MSVAGASTSPGPHSCAGCGHLLERITYVGTDDVSQRRYSVLTCEHCGLVQTAAHRDATDMAEFYTEYYGKRQSAFEPITNRLRRRRLLRAIGARTPGRILDVGCGRGGFLACMRGGGWRVSGLERPGSGYETVWKQAEVPVRTGEWGTADYPEASFDVLTFWHVFEHLPSPHAALEQASKVLTPDGILVIAVPNIAGTQAHVFRERWFHLDVPRHLFHFSPESLSALLKQHGFSVIAVNHYSVEYDTFGAIQSGLNLCCRRKNLLFDLLMGRTSVGSIVRRADVRELGDLCLTVLLTVPLGLLAAPFCWVTSWIARGATIEVYSKKEETPLVDHG